MNIRKHHALEDTIEHEYIDYFQKMGFFPFLISNRSNYKHYFSSINVGGVVLTGGIDICNEDTKENNEMQKIRDDFESELLLFCIENNIPVLGICRGMHMINKYFGGSLSHNISNHVRENHSICFVDKNEYAFNVNSFHNHGILQDDLSPKLKVLMYSIHDCVIEGLYHDEHPILAFQFHPEREKESNPLIFGMIKVFFAKRDIKKEIL